MIKRLLGLFKRYPPMNEDQHVGIEGYLPDNASAHLVAKATHDLIKRNAKKQKEWANR